MALGSRTVGQQLAKMPSFLALQRIGLISTTILLGPSLVVPDVNVLLWNQQLGRPTLMKGCTAEVMAAYASACRPACISARHCACAATTSFQGSCSRWHACAGAHRAFCCRACRAQA